MDNLYIGFFDKYTFIYTTTLIVLTPFILILFSISLISVITQIGKKINIAKVIIPFIILGFALLQIISVETSCIAYNFKTKHNEMLWKIAITTSIFPSQRAFHHLRYANYCEQNKNYEEAIKHYEKVYNYTKTYDRPLALNTTLPDLYILKSQISKARYIYIKTNNDLGLAQTCILQQNYEAALEVLDRLINKYPKSYLCYFYKALAYKELCKYELSELEMAKTLELLPKNIDPNYVKDHLKYSKVIGLKYIHY